MTTDRANEILTAMVEELENTPPSLHGHAREQRRIIQSYAYAIAHETKPFNPAREPGKTAVGNAYGLGSASEDAMQACSKCHHLPHKGRCTRHTTRVVDSNAGTRTDRCECIT